MKHKHHIIPRHMGGSDDPENLVELTPEEHAEAHRILYETHGHWQDYVAWQGLANLSEKKNFVKLMLSEAGKQGNRNRKSTNKGMKYNIANSKTFNHKGEKNPCARDFLVTHPDGTQEQVKSLKTWCELHNLNYNTFHGMCIGRGKSHKGFTAIKI